MAMGHQYGAIPTPTSPCLAFLHEGLGQVNSILAFRRLPDLSAWVSTLFPQDCFGRSDWPTDCHFGGGWLRWSGLAVASIYSTCPMVLIAAFGRLHAVIWEMLSWWVQTGTSRKTIQWWSVSKPPVLNVSVVNWTKGNPTSQAVPPSRLSTAGPVVLWYVPNMEGCSR